MAVPHTFEEHNRRPLAVATSFMMVGAAGAGIPDPNLSVIPNVVVSPDGSMLYQVTVRSSSGPVDSALVEVLFSTEVDGLVCFGLRPPRRNGPAHRVVAACF